MVIEINTEHSIIFVSKPMRDEMLKRLVELMINTRIRADVNVVIIIS